MMDPWQRLGALSGIEGALSNTEDAPCITNGALCITNGALCVTNGPLWDTNCALGDTVTGNDITRSGARGGGTGMSTSQPFGAPAGVASARTPLYITSASAAPSSGGTSTGDVAPE